MVIICSSSSRSPIAALVRGPGDSLLRPTLSLPQEATLLEWKVWLELDPDPDSLEDDLVAIAGSDPKRLFRGSPPANPQGSSSLCWPLWPNLTSGRLWRPSRSTAGLWSRLLDQVRDGDEYRVAVGSRDGWTGCRPGRCCCCCCC